MGPLLTNKLDLSFSKMFCLLIIVNTFSWSDGLIQNGCYLVGSCDTPRSICLDALIAKFMGPTWGPSGADRTQVGPMLAPWTLLSGWLIDILHGCFFRWDLFMINQKVNYENFVGKLIIYTTTMMTSCCVLWFIFSNLWNVFDRCSFSLIIFVSQASVGVIGIPNSFTTRVNIFYPT